MPLEVNFEVDTELNDLRNQVTLLKSQNLALKSEIQDWQDAEYDCSDCATGEMETLVKEWKPEIETFLDNLKNPETLSNESVKVFAVYDDQLKDIYELLTKLVSLV